MTKAIAYTYTATMEHRARITSALFAMCLVMVVAYAAYLYSAISRTVSIQKTDKAAALLAASVDALDADYIRMSSRITPDTIAAHGFSRTKVSAFIPKTASLGRVALGGHEL